MTTTATKMRSTRKFAFERWMNTPSPLPPATYSPITAPADRVGGGDAQAGEERRDGGGDAHDVGGPGAAVGAHAAHELDQVGVGAGRGRRRC